MSKRRNIGGTYVNVRERDSTKGKKGTIMSDWKPGDSDGAKPKKKSTTKKKATAKKAAPKKKAVKKAAPKKKAVKKKAPAKKKSTVAKKKPTTKKPTSSNRKKGLVAKTTARIKNVFKKK